MYGGGFGSTSTAKVTLSQVEGFWFFVSFPRRKTKSREELELEGESVEDGMVGPCYTYTACGDKSEAQ